MKPLFFGYKSTYPRWQRLSPRPSATLHNRRHFSSDKRRIQSQSPDLKPNLYTFPAAAVRDLGIGAYARRPRCSHTMEPLATDAFRTQPKLMLNPQRGVPRAAIRRRTPYLVGGEECCLLIGNGARSHNFSALAQKLLNRSNSPQLLTSVATGTQC